MKGRTYAAMLAVVLAAAWASSASAHTIGPNGGVVYQSPGLCVTDYAQLGHGNGGGKVDASILTDREVSVGIWPLSYNIGCAQARTMTAGYITYRTIYLYWGPYSTAWSVCADTGWAGNGGAASYVGWGHDYSTFVSGGWHPRCGEGYYYAQWGAFAYDGGWQPMTSAGWVGVGYDYYTYFN